MKASAEGQRGCMHTGKGTDKEKGVAENRKGGTGTILSTWKKSAKLRAFLRALDEATLKALNQHTI